MRRARKKQKPTRRRVEPNAENTVGILLDSEKRQVAFFSADMLVNQLRRDGPKIANSFDKLCDRELREVSRLMSEAMFLVACELRQPTEEDELRAECGLLLTNAINSLSAAACLLRQGYVLQPGVLIRSLIEAVSTVMHLLLCPDDLSLYKRDELKSPSTIKSAKKVLPPFGQLYAFYSDNFAHIGKLHKQFTAVKKFRVGDEALDLNLGVLKMGAWLTYVTAELAFNALVASPRYFKPVLGGFAWDPTEEERSWMTDFFKLGAEGVAVALDKALLPSRDPMTDVQANLRK